MTPEKTSEEVVDDASTDRMLEEANEIRLAIPRFSVDALLRNIPPPLPNQHMFGCSIGLPRSDKTSLSTTLLTQTSPSVYAGVFDAVYLYVPASSFASMADSPFAGHDKEYHDLSKESLERLITKLEESSKKKQNSLIIIDDFMASLKNNVLRHLLEKLICNRRHLRVSVWVITQTYRSVPLTIKNSYLLYFCSASVTYVS
ncbi:hypothetical protein T492DRAFT_845778 [Pavlovales sp. CCMP2436]|nr:hypothetical protein T492DRAFT_845778 [Pavlovales sp. CCMP2436]